MNSKLFIFSGLSHALVRIASDRNRPAAVGVRILCVRF